jgi:hypothetical protein
LPIDEELLVDHACRKIEVLLNAWKVGESNVKELYVVLFDVLDNLGCGFEHG